MLSPCGSGGVAIIAATIARFKDS
jgi:hypothetical protein